jgi:signal transduction histidine kinase
LNVTDNGIGFEVAEAFARRDSFGLSGMRERVTLLGGQLEVISHPQENHSARRRGTKISALIPISTVQMKTARRDFSRI